MASRELQAARRELRNFRSMVRRPSNWDGALEAGYRGAYEAIIRLEDADGVDVAGPLSDRLITLRWEAGLAPEEVIRAERAAFAAVERT